jgi:hypothetical protein
MNDLPDHLIRQVSDYVDFLIAKYGQKKNDKKKSKSKFKFDWEGGLSDLRNQYTSIELQHQASEWR